MDDYTISDKEVSGKIFFKLHVKKIKNNNIDESETLDNWRPKPRNKKLVISEWRKRKNESHPNIKRPDYSDYLKIKRYLKNNVEEYEIMKIFGISEEILCQIKTRPFHGLNNKYYLE